MDDKINLDAVVKYMADHSDYTVNEVRNFCDIIFNQFRDFLKEKDKIELRGLGTFFTKEHKGRYVKLKTKIIDSKNHYAILFKESKTLGSRINQDTEEGQNEDVSS